MPYRGREGRADQTGSRLPPSKPVGAHERRCPTLRRIQGTGSECTCRKGYLFFLITSTTRGRGRSVPQPARVRPPQGLPFNCTYKTQTIKTELNKHLPSTAIHKGSFEVGRVPPGGGEGATSTGRSPPAQGPPGSVPPSPKWPCPQECSFPGKPRMMRAPDCMCDLPSLSQASKWSPGADTPCCVTTPHDKQEQSDSSLCAKRPVQDHRVRHGGACLPSSEPKPTQRPQQHPRRSLSEPFPPPGNLSWKLQTGPKTLKPNQSRQEVPLAPEHGAPTPSDGGSVPTVDPPGQPASPWPASLPAPCGHLQGSPHPTQGADVPVLVTSTVGALDWQNRGPLWASRLPPFEHLQRRKGFSSARCSPAGSGARLPSPCR